MNNSIQLIRCTKGLIYDQLLFLTTFTTSFFLSNYQNGLFLIKILIDALLFQICRVLVFNFFGKHAEFKVTKKMMYHYYSSLCA